MEAPHVEHVLSPTFTDAELPHFGHVTQKVLDSIACFTFC